MYPWRAASMQQLHCGAEPFHGCQEVICFALVATALEIDACGVPRSPSSAWMIYTSYSFTCLCAHKGLRARRRGFVREASPRRRSLAGGDWLEMQRPLAASIAVEGINHTLAASATFGDYYRSPMRLLFLRGAACDHLLGTGMTLCCGGCTYEHLLAAWWHNLRQSTVT